MQFVDEEDHLSSGLRDFFQDGLEPVLKLASILGARDQGSHIERHNALVLEAFRHITVHDALRKPFGNRRFSYTRFSYENRIILGAAGKDLHHTPDLFVSADYRIELAAPRHFSEIAAVTGERLVFVFRILVGNALASPDINEYRENVVLRYAVAAQISPVPRRLPPMQRSANAPC